MQLAHKVQLERVLRGPLVCKEPLDPLAIMVLLALLDRREQLE